MSNFIEDYKKKRAEEKADYAKRNPDNLPTKFQVIIRMVVGVYLYYLIYSMWKTGELQKKSGFELVIMIAAMVLFAVVGAYVFIKGFKGYRAGKFFDPNSDDYSEEATEENEASEETVVKEPENKTEGSLQSFAKLSSAAQVSKEEQEKAYEEAKEENEER